MAIHLPLSDEAQKEAKELVAANKNVLNPASGNPTISHTQDMVLGVYYLTMEKSDTKLVGSFASLQDVLDRFSLGDIFVHDRVRVYIQNQVIETTV
jgi:DNA-directed RNA polymerase subunit beta'